ncbi:MAG TPA: class I SAM-dependent methyltransferase [Steroidobacteraceae bacterium]|jgi:SAM-dependent methyltransferase|nr:class I SAM-dependent methyltransferase [Steroidobacteraceae bacterium]
MNKLNEARLTTEAQFQDARMRRALSGKQELRDRFYFINREAYVRYVSLLKDLAGRRVVVVGSSDGGVTPLAREGVFVEGIDISPVSIATLQHAIDKEGLSKFASARVMNAETLEYPLASIDAISCSGVLHHLDTERALRCWASQLKDDGFVVLFEPLAFHPVAAMFRLLTPHMRTSDEHPLKPSDFRLMAKYFATVEPRFYGITTVVSAALAALPGCEKIAKSLLPKLESLDRWLVRTIPLLSRLCWLTVVRLGRPYRITNTAI